MTNPEDYVKQIERELAAIADPELRPGMEKYMKDKFVFFGIQAAPRREVSLKFMKKDVRPVYSQLPGVIRLLWEKPEREFQYFGTELAVRYVSSFETDTIVLLEDMITQKSWWDTVDSIAKNLAGVYFLKFPDQRGEVVERWVVSGDLWLQRSALLFQLGYKDKTDETLLFDLIRRLKDHEDFFIRKAIGWALREYSKTAPEAVRSFVDMTDLSPLSRKEGLKYLESGK
ncbi:MAG: DNA alkylation repair protein [Balneolales bacterium]|nr:DNA alkylation repair protein [Balneolales bacterium]